MAQVSGPTGTRGRREGEDHRAIDGRGSAMDVSAREGHIDVVSGRDRGRVPGVVENQHPVPVKVELLGGFSFAPVRRPM
jgi:hypothetical protein